MAFVNEEYSAEEKPLVDSLVEKRPSLTQVPGSSWWTVDRERNAFLVIVGKEGGTYEGTQETKHYVLSWQGELIRFAGDPVLSHTSKNGTVSTVMSWRIHQLFIPVPLKQNYYEVRQLICEALDALGWLYSRERVVAVHVDFDLGASHCELFPPSRNGI